MNLLIITSHLPYPLNSGGNQAQYHFINYLKDKVNVHLLFNLNSKNNTQSLLQLQKIMPEVDFIPYNWKKSNSKWEVTINKAYRKINKKLTKSNFSPSDTLPFEEMTSCFFSFIIEILNKKKIDIVQVDFNNYLPIVDIIPNTIKKVFIQHEIQFVRNQLTLSNSKNEMDTFIVKKMKDNEISYMNKYDSVVTLTSIDKQKLIENGVLKPILESPASVSSFTSTRTVKVATNRITFVGGSGHYPNLNGIMWFLDNVWPLILDQKQVYLEIIGNWSENSKREIIQRFKNVTFLGFVDSIEETINESIMIVPILIGSGMRMKIVEAANCGCPFVTTSVGVEGLNFDDSESCYITDDAITFANKVIDLLENPDKQLLFSSALRKRFNEQYSIEVLGEKRLNILKELTTC